MALIDEYKQAIQDVLDGRAKEAPRPSELPWTEDKAATMWAAAAAELIAEANGGDALPDNPGSDGTYALQNTVSSGTGTLSWASGGSAMVVNSSWDEAAEMYVLDKTWKEIRDAACAGTLVFIRQYSDLYGYDEMDLATGIYINGGQYSVQCDRGTYDTNNENDYPARS